MDKQRRKELMEEYKKIKTYMGVVKITNTENGKIFVASYPNLKNKWFTIQSHLDMGQHPCRGLQEDWKKYGKDAFTYEVLEEKDTEDITDKYWEMSQMEKPWLLELQPYDERGYNKRKD